MTRPWSLESYGDRTGWLGIRHYGAKRPDLDFARALAGTLADLHGEPVEVRCIHGDNMLWAVQHVPGVTQGGTVHGAEDAEQQWCDGHTGHYEMDYSAKRRLLVCDTCGRSDFVEVPYKVGPGNVGLHEVAK